MDEGAIQKRYTWHVQLIFTHIHKHKIYHVIRHTVVQFVSYERRALHNFVAAVASGFLVGLLSTGGVHFVAGMVGRRRRRRVGMSLWRARWALRGADGDQLYSDQFQHWFCERFGVFLGLPLQFVLHIPP
jgi:hypothetical protein